MAAMKGDHEDREGFDSKVGSSLTARSIAPLSDTEPLSHDVLGDNMSAACREFVAIVGTDNAISDYETRRAHSSTPWSPSPPSQSPALIVLPSSTSEVSAIMKVCSRRRIPATGYSGGTSFSGALTATRGGICIDFKRMDKILAIHEEDMDVVVQPAVGWQDLNAVLGRQGLFFPPDPGPGAKIGGMIAMSCSGTNAYRHGTMKNWVISITLVLADGTIVKTRNRPRKSAAGYDLTSLLVGSEGTLGLVTEAVLKVTSVPKNQHVAVTAFPSTHAAVEAAVLLINGGLPIDALELLDQYSMIAINRSGLSSRSWKERPVLFLKFSGSRQAVQEQLRMAQQAASEKGCESFEVLSEEREIDVAWSARKQVGPSLIAMKQDPSDLFLTTDAAVPISSLAEMIDWTHQIIKEAGLIGSTLGHVGDGNYHAAIVCPKTQEDSAQRIIARIQRRAIELEGTITGEHGIGLKLRDLLVEEIGDNAVDMMRKIKLALDPQCILNCDKVMRMEL
ncbi:MAG: D-lactate ferricytochrome c oxidoreductase [Candelina mexicana]|nr:MAG: D-lactate ferricytochrome c oxidoreductase [Candelina mexicana]